MSIDIDIQQIPGDVTAGNEKYVPISFMKKMQVFRIDQLSQIKSLKTVDRFQLPDNSVLHVLDNLCNDDVIDTPRFDHLRYPETYIKYIYHMTDAVPPGPLSKNYESKYIYRLPGVTKNLMAFKTEHGGAYKYLQSLDAMPRRKESLTIINYNVLFRLFVYGRLRTYRRINHILSAVLNTVLSVPGDKRHFIHLPLTTAIYPRTTFIRSKKSLAIGAITYPDSHHWITMMHFLNFIDTSTTNSIFTDIPSNRLKDINFFFTTATDDDVFFNIYNLSDLVKMNVRNRIYLRLYNHVSALSASAIDEGIVQSILSDNEQEMDDNDTAGVIDTKSVPDITVDDDIPAGVKLDTDILPTKVSEIAPILVHYTTTPVSRFSTIKLPADKVLKLYPSDTDVLDGLLAYYGKDIYIVDVDTKSLNDDKYVTVNRTFSTLIEQLERGECIGYTSDIPYKAIVEVHKVKYVPETISTDEDTPVTPKLANASKQTSSIVKSVSKVVKPTEKKQVEKKSIITAPSQDTTKVEDTTVIDHYNELLNDTKSKIEQDPTLTEKQKERYIALVNQVSDLQINNKTISQYMDASKDMGLEDSTLVNQITVPEKSAATSKLDSYSQKYNEVLLYADTASVVSSFMAQGLIPVEIVEKPIRNELTNSIEYTVRYEEIGTFKKHTVKFTMPVIDSEDVCLINGVRKKLKKQIINVPICKLSETRVSLVSNYNKTIVERKLSKNRNYLSYITALLNKGIEVKALSCEYGNAIIGMPVAYEYATLASKYLSITLTGTTKTTSPLVLCFDHHNRLQTLKVPENKYNVVLKLEQHFGVLIGTILNDNTYLFINQDNYITALTTGNTVVEDVPTSIAEYITTYISSVETVSIQQPVEYVNLKILDKQFPMGFILAYKLGLRPLLSYLKVKYKVIDKRTKNLLYTDETVGDITNDKVVYDPPLPYDQLPDHLKEDPAHAWRATTGIELIHEEPTYEEFQRIKDNWNAMTVEQKSISDTQCIELTGMTNLEFAASIELKMRAKNIKNLHHVDELKLHPDEFIITGSAAAIIHGYTTPNTDIDIVVRPHVVKRLVESGMITKNETGMAYSNKYGTVDISSTMLNRGILSDKEFDKLLKATIVVDGKYPMMDMKPLIEFYKELYAITAKPKHSRVLEYLSSQVDTSRNKSAVVKYTKETNTIQIPFKDVILVVDRYPLLHSFIIAGWTSFKTNNYYLEELDSRDVYFQILLDHKYSVNYLKGIDAFFELFIDPITKDVLAKMKEPTDVLDLLIRAVDMLTNLHTIEPSSVANHRIRGYEQFNAILYNELSRQYATYLNNRSSGATFSINTEAVYQRIIMNQSFSIAEDINPIHNLKEKTSITFAGVGGRSADSFVVDDRRYPKDGVGVISEATVDSGKVAINAQLSTAPNISNARGIILPEEERVIASGTVISPAVLLMPFSDRDDQL